MIDKEMNDWNNYLELYLNEVIRPYFPDAKIKQATSSGSPDSVQKSAAISINSGNIALLAPDYFYNKELKFIHYTSLQNLLNILEEGAIRMYDFNHLNDPLELIHSKNILKKIPNTERQKENLFCLSMNCYDEVNQDNFDMWRFYGQNGKGIGVVLTIDNSNRNDWYNYYLSKVYYSEEELNTHSEIYEKHIEFNEKYVNKFHVSFIDNEYPLYYLLGFHKVGIYKSENEVRLLRIIKQSYSMNSAENNIFHSINYKNQHTSYSKINLACSEDSSKDMLNPYEPHIIIQKIILGYEFNEQSCNEIYDCINKIASKKLGYFISVVISKYKELLKS